MSVYKHEDLCLDPSTHITNSPNVGGVEEGGGLLELVGY